MKVLLGVAAGMGITIIAACGDAPGTTCGPATNLAGGKCFGSSAPEAPSSTTEELPLPVSLPDLATRCRGQGALLYLLPYAVDGVVVSPRVFAMNDAISTASGGGSRVRISAWVENDNLDLQFDAPEGEHLTSKRVYDRATFDSAHDSQEPGLTISVGSTLCSRSAEAKFYIDEISVDDGGRYRSFTAAFHHPGCVRPMFGCIHVDAP